MIDNSIRAISNDNTISILTNPTQFVLYTSNIDCWMTNIVGLYMIGKGRETHVLDFYSNQTSIDTIP